MNKPLALLVGLALLAPFQVAYASSADPLQVKVDGFSHTTVDPEATINVWVNAYLSNSNDWESTRVIVGNISECVDTPDFTEPGDQALAFPVRAPATPGVYDLTVSVHALRDNDEVDDGCASSAWLSKTIDDAIHVRGEVPAAAPAPAPTPAPQPEPAPVFVVVSPSMPITDTSTGTVTTIGIEDDALRIQLMQKLIEVLKLYIAVLLAQQGV